MKKLKFWLSLLVAGVVVAGILFVGFYLSLPVVGVLKDQYPRLKLDEKGKVAEVEFIQHQPAGWTPLPEIASSLPQALVVSEDWSFYQHKGVDFAEIWLALRQTLQKGKKLRGASTITQQLAKNVFYSHERSYQRKFREIFTARDLERALEKDKILEIYLNIVEFGRGVYGVKHAARHYFQKAPAELTPKESAFLIMLLPSPIRYSQSFRDQKLTPYANKTVNRILKKMEKKKFLTPEEVQAHQNTRLSFERENEVEVLPPEEPKLNLKAGPIPGLDDAPAPAPPIQVEQGPDLDDREFVDGNSEEISKEKGTEDEFF